MYFGRALAARRPWSHLGSAQQRLTTHVQLLQQARGIDQLYAQNNIPRKCAHTFTAATPELVEVEKKLTDVAKNIDFHDPIELLPQEPAKEELQAFQQRLGHQFSNSWLLRLALVHSSAARLTNNSSLSWIGDMALGLVTTEQIMDSMGVLGPLGVQAQLREAIISRQQCVQQARALGLDRLMVIGISVKGHISNNMLAELLEAVLGAVYVDGGLPALREVFRKHYAHLLPSAHVAAVEKMAAPGEEGDQ